jgi:radical SAM superfamily enzyme YgiQ (UPF0313 family)
MTPINDLAYLIAKINRNIVLSKMSNEPHLRVGVMPLDVQSGFIGLLLKNEDKEEILLPHCDNISQIRNSLEGIVYDHKSVIESFSENGIAATNKFKKVVFIASLGAKEGEQINYFMPSYGIEKISSFLNRYSKDTVSMVINPNLSGEERLYSFIRSEMPDIIGFSTIPISFKNDAKVIANSTLLSPDSLKIAGGYNIEDYDINQLFDCFSLDIVVFGVGEDAVLRISEGLDTLDKTLPSIPNIVYKKGKQIIRNHQERRRTINFSRDISDEIPQYKNDLFHGRSYKEANDSLDFNNKYNPEEQLTQNSLRIRMSDFCKGSCKWCAAPKRQLYFTPIEDIIKQMEIVGDYEGVAFEDNDLCFSKVKVLEVCDAIIKNGYAKIPKVGKSRVDSVNEEILKRLAEAGFTKFGYGVESFVQDILDKLGKNITLEQIHRALNLTIDAGITPIINIMMFSPFETKSSLIETVNQAMSYVSRGAYLNTAVGMNSTFGSDIVKTDKDMIIYEDIFYDGMKKTFKNPIRLRCANQEMQDLLCLVLKEREEYKTILKGNGVTSFSSHLNSLCAFRTIYKVLGLDYSKAEILVAKAVEKR